MRMESSQLPPQEPRLRHDTATAAINAYDHPSWLPSCGAIFLDVGSNIGVQIRKFYEPERYVDAPAIELFDRVFGSNAERLRRKDICALGLEPNPKHHGRLEELQANATARGWRVHFYPYAAWKAEGTMTLNMHLESTEKSHLFWDAALDENCTSSCKERNGAEVRTVDLAAFIASLPAKSVKLMKLDIEGAEYETVSRMLQARVLCKGIVDEAFIETHVWGDTSSWNDDRTYDSLEKRVHGASCEGSDLSGLPTTMVQMDDESYMYDDGRKDDRPSTGPFAKLAQFFSGVRRGILDIMH